MEAETQRYKALPSMDVLPNNNGRFVIAPNKGKQNPFGIGIVSFILERVFDWFVHEAVCSVLKMRSFLLVSFYALLFIVVHGDREFDRQEYNKIVDDVIKQVASNRSSFDAFQARVTIDDTHGLDGIKLYNQYQKVSLEDFKVVGIERFYRKYDVDDVKEVSDDTLDIKRSVWYLPAPLMQTAVHFNVFGKKDPLVIPLEIIPLKDYILKVSFMYIKSKRLATYQRTKNAEPAFVELNIPHGVSIRCPNWDNSGVQTCHDMKKLVEKIFANDIMESFLFRFKKIIENVQLPNE